MSEWLLARVSSEDLVQGFLRESAKGGATREEVAEQEFFVRAFVEWSLEEGYAFAAVIK